MMIAHTRPKDSDVRITVWLAWLFLAAAGCAASCPNHQAKDGPALVQLEQNWAEALSRHDADAVGCILAEEFQDVDPDGRLHDRAETLAAIPDRQPGINRLSELAPHVHGDFAYIRGLATLLDPAGNIKARVRFTDVYVYRDGRWRAVAGQESLVRPGAG